jgi:hypothetical protein
MTVEVGALELALLAAADGFGGEGELGEEGFDVAILLPPPTRERLPRKLI